MKKFSVFILAMGVAFTASSSYALGWSGWTKVSLMRTGTGATPLFKLEDFGDAGTGCDDFGYIRFDTIEDNDSLPGSTRSYSTLLAAFMAGKEVNVQSISCSHDYPYFRSLQVR